MRVLPLEPSAVATDITFGAQVLDYNDDTDFRELEALVYDKLVVVIRNQASLTPLAQYNLTKKFDPDSESYGHGHNQKLMSASVLQSDLVSIPAVPQVKLLGHGHITSHEGLENIVLKHPQHHTFHKSVLSPELEAQGFTRFYRWHMDAALYGHNPPRVTSLLALKTPAERTQIIKYDDGSGDEIPNAPLGTTAFISGERAFQILPSHLKEFALKTMVRYAPHPYIWIKNAKAQSDGLGIVSDGLELPFDQLPPIEEEKIKVYPMVWKNRVTGRLSLQVHPCCVQDLITDGVSLNGDLVKVRAKLNEILRPGIDPTRVLTHNWVAGDLVIFSNRSVLHTVTGTMLPTDTRIYHQCNLAGSDEPLSA